MMRVVLGALAVVWLISVAPAADKTAGDGASDAIVARIGDGRWQHGGMVTGLALSPDGRIAATSDVLSAQVVECPLGRVMFELPPCPQFVRAMAFSDDGKILIDGGAHESHVVLWNVATGKTEREIRIHEQRAFSQSLALSPDGRTLAVFYDYYPRPGIVDRGVGIFDVDSGRALFQEDQWRTITAFRFEPRGEAHNVVFVNRQRKRQRLNIDTGKLTEVEGEAGYWPLSIGGGPVPYDTEVYATADERFSFRIAGDAVVLGGREYGGFRERPRQVAVTRDGRRLAVGGGRGRVHVWDLESGERLDPPRLELSDVRAAFSRDGRYVMTSPLSADESAPAIVWHADRGQRAEEVEEEPARFAPPQGPFRAEQQWDTIVVVDRESDRELRRFSFLPDDNKAETMFAPYLASAVASADGKLIAAAGYFNVHVGLPDEETGPCVQIFDAESGRFVARYVEKERFDKRPMIALSPDGKLLAVATLDVLRLLDPGTGDIAGTLRGHRGAIRSLAFSPDGRRLVTAADDNTCIVWRVDPGAFLDDPRLLDFGLLLNVNTVIEYVPFHGEA